jgi:hypothetical protein
MKCDFEATITEADVREVVRWQSRPAVLSLIVGSMAVALSLGAFCWQYWDWAALSVPIAIAVWLPFGIRRMIQKTTRKQFRAIASEQPVKISISGEGIRVTSANSDGRAGWELFNRFHELPRSIALRLKTGTCLIIPKGDVNDAQLEELRAFLPLVIGKRAS